MASGFLILEDGRCFARRWTAYDEIIRIASQELRLISNGHNLAEWLDLQIPINEKEEEADAGWGFQNFRINDWINRELDLRSLTSYNQNLFWTAILNGKIKLDKGGENYSSLNPDLMEDLIKMHELSLQGEPPLDFSDWTKLADPCQEKNGPGWNKNES